MPMSAIGGRPEWSICTYRPGQLGCEAGGVVMTSAEVRAGTIEDGRSTRAWWWVLTAVVLTVGATWAPGVGERFGPSYEGYTGATWGSAVEAVEQSGWLESRVGMVRRDETYPNHPPLLTVALVASTSVFGDGHWQMRLPVVADSLAAVLLLYVLCRRLGASPGAAAAGAAVAGLSPMLLAYGSMVDTWIFGFPFGLVVLLTLTDRRVDGWRCAAAVACGFCCWQGVILAALALPVAGKRFGLRSPMVASLIGGIIGALAVTRWVEAPDNGLTIGWPFDGAALHRLVAMLGLGLLLAPLALLVRDRAVGVVALAAPVAYGVLFTFHADWHDFWLYWLLAPVAIGGAVMVDRYGTVGRAWVAAVILGTLLTSAGPIAPQRAGEIADPVVAAVKGLDQPWLPIVDGDDSLTDEAEWVGYETGLPTRTVELKDVPAGWTYLALRGAEPACSPVVGAITLCD